jgi:hypothetical protein
MNASLFHRLYLKLVKVGGIGTHHFREFFASQLRKRFSAVFQRVWIQARGMGEIRFE